MKDNDFSACPSCGRAYTYVRGTYDAVKAERDAALAKLRRLEAAQDLIDRSAGMGMVIMPQPDYDALQARAERAEAVVSAARNVSHRHDDYDAIPGDFRKLTPAYDHLCHAVDALKDALDAYGAPPASGDGGER